MNWELNSITNESIQELVEELENTTDVEDLKLNEREKKELWNRIMEELKHANLDIPLACLENNDSIVINTPQYLSFSTTKDVCTFPKYKDLENLLVNFGINLIELDPFEETLNKKEIVITVKRNDGKEYKINVKPTGTSGVMNVEIEYPITQQDNENNKIS